MADDDDEFQSDGPQTPIEGSGAYPALQRGAEELAEQLRAVRKYEATVLRRQLQEIVEVFKSWSPDNRPSDEDRRAINDRLVAVTKEAYKLLGRYGAER